MPGWNPTLSNLLFGWLPPADLVRGLPIPVATWISAASLALALAASVGTAGALPAGGDAPPPLAPQLEKFRPYLDKTWRGTGPGPQGGSTMTDISRWERALNGQAIRTLHSVNDGEYGGESLIFWDAQKQTLVFFYFTTAGFYTQGTMSFDGASFVAHETVTGNQNGITEVRSTSEILADGRLHTKSEYLANGQWVPGHEFLYTEDPSAEVKFR